MSYTAEQAKKLTIANRTIPHSSHSRELVFGACGVLLRHGGGDGLVRHAVADACKRKWNEIMWLLLSCVDVSKQNK